MTLLITVLAATVLAVNALSIPQADLGLLGEWEQFKSTHSKRYQSEEEESARFVVWHENRGLIARHNEAFAAGQVSYSLAMNQFGDLSGAEFRDRLPTFAPTALDGQPYYVMRDGGEEPAEMDWRAKGAVTAVKDQGECQSCWSFSTTGALEGHMFIKTKNLTEFSEQQLIDCSTKNNGCHGGLMSLAFDYIREAGGLQRENDYPYTGLDGHCHAVKSKFAVHVKNYIQIPRGNEEAMKDAVATTGPVCVGIDASHSSFQFYHSGIYDDKHCSSTRLDHAILVVGYGREQDTDFWIIKNSWATTWGENGYAKIRRGVNRCGIANMGVFPVVY